MDSFSGAPAAPGRSTPDLRGAPPPPPAASGTISLRPPSRQRKPSLRAPGAGAGSDALGAALAAAAATAGARPESRASSGAPGPNSRSSGTVRAQAPGRPPRAATQKKRLRFSLPDEEGADAPPARLVQPSRTAARLAARHALEQLQPGLPLVPPLLLQAPPVPVPLPPRPGSAAPAPAGAGATALRAAPPVVLAPAAAAAAAAVLPASLLVPRAPRPAAGAAAAAADGALAARPPPVTTGGPVGAWPAPAARAGAPGRAVVTS